MAIALLAAILLTLAIVVAVRFARRSPRARAAAAQALSEAAEVLLRLDDAVEQLDVAFEAVDAVETSDAPTDLRRARTAAHRARDRGFVDVSQLEADDGVAARRRDEARRLRAQLEVQLERVGRTRARLSEWALDHRTAPNLLTAARRRRQVLVENTGDLEPLLAVLRERFAPDDREDAESAARSASAAIDEADAALSLAASDPLGAHLFDVTTSLRRAERQLRAIEDAHRIALQAADNAEAELRAAREEIATAIDLASRRPAETAPDAAERMREAARDLEAAAIDSPHRPRRTIATVARVREIRDLTLGEAMSPRLRLEAARAALPGTLACARAALADADVRDDEVPIAARLRLERARRELAAARAATDAEHALANARAAWHAVSGTAV